MSMFHNTFQMRTLTVMQHFASVLTLLLLLLFIQEVDLQHLFISINDLLMQVQKHFCESGKNTQELGCTRVNSAHVSVHVFAHHLTQSIFCFSVSRSGRFSVMSQLHFD